jgi:hypothetical protein
MFYYTLMTTKIKTEHFYDDIFYYSPTYYPGYKENKEQEIIFNQQYPYIAKESNPDINLQIFYNTTDDDTIPWGSSYKYTIPKSIDDIISSNHNSINMRQKRTRLEKFENQNKSIQLKQSNDDTFCYIFILIVILCFYLYQREKNLF